MKNTHTAIATLIADAFHVEFEEPFTYLGLCDASAAAALGEDLFVVANDENNRLKVYRRGVARPVDIIDLSDFLETAKDKESDLEGAATIGERIYWISSHGRNKKGKIKKSRFRFFATEATGDGQHIKPVGKPYAGLLDDMVKAAHLKQYGIEAAAGLTPEADGGFNIEGLAATPEGGLLIGLRNPAPEGRALVIPLLNPADVVEGKDAALFGEAIPLDLGGMGIRSMELVGLAYMIVAGPKADQGDFGLYQWSGKPAEAPVMLLHEDFDAVRPEALFAIPGTRKVQILSDDGGEHVKTTAEEEQAFQSVTITL